MFPCNRQAPHDVKARFRIILLTALLLTVSSVSRSFAQSDSTYVSVGDQRLFSIQAPLGTITPENRARLINEHLKQFLEDPKSQSEQIVVVDYTILAIIKAGSVPLVEVTAADADSARSQPKVLADEWAGLLREAFKASRGESYESRLLTRIFLGILYPVAFVAILRLVAYASKRLATRILHPLTAQQRTVRVQGVAVVSPRRVRVMIVRTLAMGRYLIFGLLTYLFVLLMLANFPQTRPYSQMMVAYLTEPLVFSVRTLASNLPRIGGMILILFGVRFSFRIIDTIAEQARAGMIKLEPYLAPDMAPLGAFAVKTCILFLGMLLIAFVFPGEGRYFVYATLLLMAVSLLIASIPVASNLTAGFMTVYMRLFQVGDTLTIGGHTGEIVEKTLLSVKLIDHEGNEITIPNRQVLGGPIINRGPSAVHAFHILLTTPREVSYSLMETLLLESTVEIPGVRPVLPDSLKSHPDHEVIRWEATVPLRDLSQAHRAKADLYHRIMESCGECGIKLLLININEQREG